MSPQTSSSEKALANQFLAPGRVPTTAKERVPATKTVHLQSRARYTSEMRSELLGMVRFPPLYLGPTSG
jgi:SNARE protein 1